MSKQKLKKIKCLRCQYEWTPRVADVRSCPNCGSAYWDQERSIEDAETDEEIQEAIDDAEAKEQIISEQQGDR